MNIRASSQTLSPEMAPGELQSLSSLLSERGFTGRHLEIGTAAGGTLCHLMACYPSGRQPDFTVVDPMRYFPDQLETVQRNLRQKGFDPAAVTFRVMTSREAFEIESSRGSRFDFMLIDGAHKIRYVTEDLRWLRLLNVGGRACFHDYAPRCPGVMLAVDRFLKRNDGFRRETLNGSLLVVERLRENAGIGVTAWDLQRAALIAPWLQLKSSLAKRMGFGRR